jgi:hypothetical protein
MLTTIEFNIEDAIENLKTTDKTELSKKMIKDNLDASEIIEAAKYAGYNENALLEQIDDGIIINYLIKQGYTIAE